MRDSLYWIFSNKIYKEDLQTGESRDTGHIAISQNILVNVSERMCDIYCRYPSQIGMTQEGLNAICDNCPLANLIGGKK